VKDLADIAYHHAQYLAVDIGNRPIGSPSNHAAQKYIEAVFRSQNLDTELQEFACPDWVEIKTRLELRGLILEASANTFSPSAEVSAPTIAIGTLVELEKADIGGRIPIFYGSLAQSEIAAKAAIYVSERDRRIVQFLESRAAAGVITVNPTLNARWRLIEDFDFGFPSVTVSARSGLELLKRAGELVSMHILTRKTPSHSANVVGRMQGELPDKIVICAHYDTKVDTPGAYDNASGVAAILTLCECLKDRVTKPRHTFEWVAFSGEEIYGLGDMTYAHDIGNDFSKITTVLNIDGIGPLTSSNSIAVFSATQNFSDLVDRLTAGYPGFVRIDPWPASDHYIFYSHGVPSIAMTGVGIKDIYHTPVDSIEWLSPKKLEEAICLAMDILVELDTKDMNWARMA
jgi:aminopeptidase YwaD